MLYLNIADTDVMTDSKYVLKEKIKKAVNKVAHEYLLEIGRTHSKVRTNLYPNIDGMKYMKDPRFTPDIVNLLFKFRTRMFNVKNNFRNNYRQTDILCPLCKKAMSMRSPTTKPQCYDCKGPINCHQNCDKNL